MQTRASSRARQAASMRLKMANRAAQRKHEFTFSFAHTHTYETMLAREYNRPSTSLPGFFTPTKHTLPNLPALFVEMSTHDCKV